MLLGSSTSNGVLKTYSRKKITLSTDNICTKKEEFVNWVFNSSILRAYNSLEILVLSTIAQEYFGFECSMEHSKSHVQVINKEIDKFLNDKSLKINRKNNKYIIKFLEEKSPSLNTFLNTQIRVDSKVIWKEYFDLLATLRHVIAHNDMLVDENTLNHIKSNAKEMFRKYFIMEKNSFGLYLLRMIPEFFPEILKRSCEFGINLAKHIKNQPNLNFASFH